MAAIPWISITLFLPLLGALLIALVPKEHEDAHRHVSLVIMGLTFLVSLPLALNFNDTYGGYQLTSAVENIAWIPGIGARYHVAIDGISLWLVMLTTFLGPIVVLASYHYIQHRTKEYHVALLVLQTAMIGALVAQDMLLFYMFWELMLVPMYFLVGIWGGDKRIYAAVKLFLYTMVGSVLMLIGLIYIYQKGGGDSFALSDMIEAAQLLSNNEQRWLFTAFALAFLIKVPLFPFHTWLPDAHVQAPTAGSVILASILLKMGTYGLIRYAMPMLPNGLYWAAPVIAVLSVIGIIYAAVIAYVQKDVKKLVAYSSVSHLGFVTLGLMAMTPGSVNGAIYQSLAHGIATGGLFLCIGILYERRHTRLLSEYGGLAKQVPRFATAFIIIAMASAGVPGLAGFVGEFMILTGTAVSKTLTFGAEPIYFAGIGFGPELTSFLFVTFAATGVILGAAYILHMVQKIMWGPLENPENFAMKDLSLRESVYLAPIIFMCFFMGIKPQPFIDRMDDSVDLFIAEMESSVQSFQGQLIEVEDEDGNIIVQEVIPRDPTALIRYAAQDEAAYFSWYLEFGDHEQWSIPAAIAETNEHAHSSDDEHGEHGDDDHGDDADHAPDEDSDENSDEAGGH